MYKMVDNKTQKVSIWEIIKDPELSSDVPDRLKTKTICKHAVKKLSFLIRYIPDQDKTYKMCDEVILKNSGMLNVYS